MVELPETNVHKGFSGVDSIVKRTWSGKKFDGKTNQSSMMQDTAKTNQTGFKLGNLTNEKGPNRRIFSAADAHKRNTLVPVFSLEMF